jgi:glutathione peroxidase-family protein
VVEAKASLIRPPPTTAPRTVIGEWRLCATFQPHINRENRIGKVQTYFEDVTWNFEKYLGNNIQLPYKILTYFDPYKNPTQR